MGPKARVIKFYSGVSDRSEVVHLIAKLFAPDGGEGSGNHHHAGRPGHVGGSAPQGGGSASGTAKNVSSNFDEIKSGIEKAEERLSDNNPGEQFRFFAGYMKGAMYGQGAGHDAIMFYGYHGDVLANNLLRKGTPRNYEQQKEWNDHASKTKEQIDALTSVCEQNKLRKPAVVFRGVSGEGGLSKMLGLGITDTDEIQKMVSDPDFSKSLVGTTFSDPAFISTSIDRDFVYKSEFAGPCIMEVYCPEGTQGVYFGDQGRFTDEHEFLLQRGTQFVIVDAYVENRTQRYYPNDNTLRLKVAVLSQEPKEIPDKYNNPFPEGRKEILDSIKEDRQIPHEEMVSLFPNADENILKELEEIRGKGERTYEDTERLWSLIMVQRELGYVSDIEAAELEAYTMKIEDRIKSQDGYAGEMKLLKREAEMFEDFPKVTEYSEARKAVQEKYPDADESVVPLLMRHMISQKKTAEAIKSDVENGHDDRLTDRKREAVKTEQELMDYISKRKRLKG